MGVSKGTPLASVGRGVMVGWDDGVFIYELYQEANLVGYEQYRFSVVGVRCMVRRASSNELLLEGEKKGEIG